MARIYCLFVQKSQQVFIGNNLSAIAREFDISTQVLSLHLKKSNFYSNNRYTICCVDKGDFLKKPGNNKKGNKNFKRKPS